MKITLTNSNGEPIYIKFADEPDLNINPGDSFDLDCGEKSELKFIDNYIETKNIERPV